MRNILFFLGICMIPFNSYADVKCESSDNHHRTIAQCLLKSMIENRQPSSPWTEEVQKQVIELSSRGLTNSMEYSALFLGGSKDEWTYIASVDFSSLNQFQSVAAVIKVSSSGSAIVKKVFLSAEIKDFIK